MPRVSKEKKYIDYELGNVQSKREEKGAGVPQFTSFVFFLFPGMG
jgi:hypothetical protein